MSISSLMGCGLGLLEARSTVIVVNEAPCYRFCKLEVVYCLLHFDVPVLYLMKPLFISLKESISAGLVIISIVH